MKGGQAEKTKVVVRHLPPTISQGSFLEQIDVVFSGRYNWVSFRPGKSSQKHQSYSRAYIDFKRPEDVIEFAEFFNGHLFVNEKGTQFRAIVEYAPSQHVPKQWSKKDGREGTIVKDPAYLEFLELISKPAENLPSAEIQLERREAERAASAAKDAPIVTPLMDFVRQKRAAKTGSRYVLRDSAKSTSGKDKSTYLLVPKRDDQQFSDKSTPFASASGTEVLEDESELYHLCLLIVQLSGGMSKQNAASFDKNVTSSAIKQSQRRESSGRIIRSILLNKDSRQNQSSGFQSEQQIQSSNLEKEKRLPRPAHVQLVLKDVNGSSDDKFVGNDLHGFSGEKQEKRTRNKDRPDRVVWTPLRRSDGSYASDESLSSSASQSTHTGQDSSQGNLGDIKVDSSNSRSGDVKTLGSGRSSHSSLDNGSHKHFGRRGPSHTVRDADGSSLEGKPSKRGGGASGYGSHEKQVWVQKSSSGS
ncbi:conserved hypothetical protein [Ricinus communis]|uniref:UPF3 domain-containing protein n=1 Tax=Ricinus communis TaxID=3988 RepID=B9SKB6_RICCO|nr:conserved hypothetical protein [Ricinus communis]